MSVELPEAKILAAQINEMLVGKKVASHETMDSEKLQRIGFMNRELADYEMLDGQTILGAASPDSPGFTFKYFRDSFSGQNRALKPLLVGKDAWKDLHGKHGGYTPRMGPNMKDGGCPRCGAAIQRLAHGGGHVYLCPECQKE